MSLPTKPSCIDSFSHTICGADPEQSLNVIHMQPFKFMILREYVVGNRFTNKIFYKGFIRKEADSVYEDAKIIYGNRVYFAFDTTNIGTLIKNKRGPAAIKTFWTKLPDSIREMGYFLVSNVPVPEPIFKRAYKELPEYFVTLKL